MKKMKYWMTAAAILIVCGAAATAMAEDKEEAKPLEHAVWLEPQSGQAPWIDMRSIESVTPAFEIAATGPAFALVKTGDIALTAIDGTMKDIATVVLPENTQWFTVDEKNRIFAHDGAKLYVAQAVENAATTDGYQHVIDLADVRAIDIANEHAVYADGSTLRIVDLNTGSLKQIALADFMNDEKVQAMTPEAVQAAEEKAAKSKKSSKKSTKKDADPETPTQVTDIQGIWWRADGTGVIRVKSLLNTRTFVTTDNGRSWRQMNDSPKDIRHSFGWIWDGNDRVLSKDGSSWLQVAGEKISPTDRWTTTHAATAAPTLPENWLYLDSPVMPVTEENATDPNHSDENANAQSESESSATKAQPIVTVSMIPQAHSAAVSEIELPDSASLYTPTRPRGGMQIGLFRDATCKDGAKTCDISEMTVPSAWMIAPERGFETIALPEGCIPAFATAALGLGILTCKAENDDYLVYTRTADTEWQAETLLPSAIAAHPEIMTAEDGTMILLGQCGDETVELPVMPTEEEMAAGIEPAPEIRTTYVCNAAVRLPEDIGQPDIWRIEHMENAHGFIPMTGGRLISVEGASSTQRKLTLRTPQATDTIVDQFDATPYSGIVTTYEGCLALYDGSVSEESLRSDYTQQTDPETGAPVEPMQVRLLSTNGKLAQMDCASSRATAELASGNVTEYEEAPGDDRYGLRASAGGFFTTNDVKTWNFRIEALIPILEGHYEIGLMYRMGGGNTSSAFGHLGLISIRWRYDKIEKFDFAVGAGLGYGMMCGYDASADPGANDDDENTKPSGYQQCSSASIRYMLGGIATYKFADRWKIFISAEMLGGTNWGFDLTGGIEIRF